MPGRRSLFAAILSTAAVLFTAPASAQQPAPAPRSIDQVLGDPAAPVTIIEYSSLTCPHCAQFHRDTMPKLKAEWIDTGKAKLVYRDFPLDPLAQAAAMLPHCAGPERYFGFLETLFRSQEQWARSKNPGQALAAIARLGGMSEQEFNACLSDQGLLSRINARKTEGMQKYNIESTPTFIIEGGKKIAGSIPYEDFARQLEAAAKAK